MEFVKIGKIINTFGIRGELKVDIYTDFVDERYKKGSTVYIGDDKLAFVMDSYRVHKGFLLIKFKDIDDINLVEKYKNMFIFKSSDDIKPLKDGYYFSDLKGLDVYDDDDKFIGKVLYVQEGIKNNNLRVKVNDKEVLIPFIPVFIKSVSLDEKKIVINNIEGLV